MKKPKQTSLCEALADVKVFQDVITNTWSPYYGHFLLKIVGSDTIPFLLMTKEGTRLSLRNEITQMETSYFRLEEVHHESCRIRVTLLQGFDVEGQKINLLQDVARLEKSDTEACIDLCDMAAIQLLNPNLVGRTFYVESKW